MLDGWIERDPPIAPGALRKMNQAIIRVQDDGLREALLSARNAIMSARKGGLDVQHIVEPLNALAAGLDRWPEKGMATDVRSSVQRAVESVKKSS